MQACMNASFIPDHMTDVLGVAGLLVTSLFSALCGIITTQTSGFCRGHAVAWLIEALCYKPEGRGFYSR
jgi:hypothetical protein